MKNIFLLFVLLSVNIMSQSIDELYNNDLPLKAKEIKPKIKVIDQSLKIYGELNPELNYYYIKYLETTYDSLAEDDYFVKNLYKIHSYYELQKEKWIKLLMGKIEQESMDDFLKDKCLGFLDDYLDDLKEINIPELQERTDYNRLNYVVVKFYLQDKVMIYDPSRNYKDERLRLEKEKLQLLNQINLNPVNYSKSDLDDLITLWYIYSREELNSNKLLSSIIIKVLQEHYLNKNINNKLSVSLGVSYQDNFIKTSASDYTSTYYKEDQTKYDFHAIPIALGLRFKLYLSKYFRTFNYLSFKVDLGFSQVNKVLQLNKLDYWYKNVDGVAKRSEIFDFTKNEAKVTSVQNLALSASIPFFYFGTKLSLNAGFGIRAYNTNYKLTYDYSYRLFESEFLGPHYLKTENGSIVDKSGNDIEFAIYPLLFVNYDISTLISLEAGSNFYGFTCSVNYNF